MFLPKTFVRPQKWIRNICSKGKTFLRYFSLNIGRNPNDLNCSIFRLAHLLFWKHNFYIHANPYLMSFLSGLIHHHISDHFELERFLCLHNVAFPPPLFSVKFIPFTFSPCEPRLFRKNQLAELIFKEKTDQEATLKQPIFFPTIAFTLVRIAHGCKSPLFIVQS